MFWTAPLAQSQVANIIPANRRVDWTLGTNVGVRGGILNRTAIYVTIPAGSSAATINAALASCPPNHVVMLGPGDFNLTAPLAVKSNTTLRGSGTGVTKLHSSTGTLVTIRGSANVSTPGNITNGYTKGSSVITVAGGATLSAGDFIGVYQDDEPWVYKPDGGDNHIYSVHRVDAVNGADATIWPALLHGSSGFNPKYVRMTQGFITSAGVEDLSLYPEDDDVTFPLLMNSAYGCWAKNLTIHDIPYCGVFIYQSLGCEITHVDIPSCVSIGDGYGIVLDNQTPGNTAIAIYNCYFNFCRHGIIASGQQGCVFAYNYTVNEHAQSGVQDQTAGFNASHNAEGMMSLWEGNYGNHIWSDRIHGGAAFQTLWRCRFTGNNNFFNLSKNATVRLERGSYSWNVVGCVLGDTWASDHIKYRYEFSALEWDTALSSDFGGIYLLGYTAFGQALDASVGSTILRFGNYDYWHGAVFSDTPGITATVDNSLSWTAKPSWFGDRPWPAFDTGTPGAGVASSIPAGFRFINGIDPPGAVGPGVPADQAPSNARVSISVQ